MPSEPSVAIIVCTKERASHVRHLLRCLASQTRAPREIVVVDGTAEPTLAADVAAAGGVYLHRPDQTGLPAARNLGVSVASCDVCLFLDDDVVPSPTLVEQVAVAYADHPGVGGVGGVPVEPRLPPRLRLLFVRLFQQGPYANPVARLQRGAPGGPPLRVVRLSGAVASYRREVLLDEHFDENLVGYALGEDMEHGWRVARRHDLLILPDLRVRHLALGWSSEPVGARFERKVAAISYHYHKNLSRSWRGRVAFAWFLTGIVLESLLVSATRFSWDPVRGCARGIADAARDLSGAGGFIARDPRFDRQARVGR